MQFDAFKSITVRRALPLLLGIALFAVPSMVRAQQLTGEALLGEIVDDYGPKYSDVDTAIEQLLAGQISSAVQSFEAAKQKNANLPPARLMLAQCLFRLKQASRGQAALQEAVREDRSDPGAYVYLGEVALQTGRLAEAELLYARALQLAERYTGNAKRKKRLMVGAYSGQVSMAELREDWQGAKDILDKSLEIDPDNSLTLTRMGRVLFKMSSTKEDDNKVYRIFQQLHQKDPNTAFPDVNMALLYQQADKPQNAKVMMQRAAQKDGSNVRTRLAVAKWALNAGELQMAQENAQAALQLESNSLEARLYLGLVARFQNKMSEAEEIFKEAHFQSPTHLGAITQLALVLVDQADERKKALALAYARLNTQLYSDLKDASGREAAVTLGWVLSKLGQPQAAQRAVQQALSGGTRLSADSAYHAAKILYDNGLTDPAGQILEQSLKAESTFPNRADAEALLSRIKNQ